jgi:hypothetical protein
MLSLYHGSSTALGITGVLLSPTQSQFKRVTRREQYEELVFLTVSLSAARAYAKKAVKRFGGAPAIYRSVAAAGLWRKGNGDWCCDRAWVERCE